MIALTSTSLYKQLKLNKHHAYLFFSADQLLNEAVALNFAKTLVCSNDTACGSCPACKQFESDTYPDVNIVKQNSIKVEDVSKIINKLNTKPISGEYQVFVILDADTINETAQNKLLKSIEEPTASSVFIFTTTKTDKLLPTILSRLNKVFVSQPNKEDKLHIANEYAKIGTDINFYPNTDCSLTEAVNMSTNNAYSTTIDTIFNLLSTLTTTADIPRAVDGMEEFDKNIFLTCLQDIFLSMLKNNNKYGERINQLKTMYTTKAVAHIVPLIDEAYKKQIANVNFYFILDNLLFDILKERFLCK